MRSQRELPEGAGCAFWMLIMLALYAAIAAGIILLVKLT
jgi:hypothetical protein